MFCPAQSTAKSGYAGSHASRRAAVVAGAALAALVAARGLRAQPVQGDVAKVGFSCGTPSGSVIREGQWFPILLQLTAQGSQVFQGQLRVEGIDLDGDFIAYTDKQFTVTPDAGMKRVWCYAVVNSLSEYPRHVDILTDDGFRINRIPMPPCDVITNDDFLILDLSERRISYNALLSDGWSPGQFVPGARPFYRNVVVANLTPAELPDRWFGLEAVNAIIWDAPKPSELSIAQMDALIRWIRRGGHLVVGVGASWDAIAKSALAEIMPLAGEARTIEVRKLDLFFQKFVDTRRTDREFAAPISVTTAGLAPGALRTLGEFNNVNLIATRPIGSGSVTAVAATLRDLTGAFTHVIQFAPFYMQLFNLARHTDIFRANELNRSQSFQQFLPLALYEEVVRPISFARESTVRGFLVFLFVVGYIAIATVGSWFWLGRRKLRHLSWSVFAGFAVLASALGLLTITAMRGLSYGVQTLQVIDAEAGDRQARARCYFGYRSAIRDLAALSLPGDGCFLRPLSRGNRAANKYVTPLRYEAVPASATLADTPIRATLKQFEGFWEGELAGAIRTNLTASVDTGEITPGSWIVNDLDHELAGGFLLYIDPRCEPVRGGLPVRASALARWYDPELTREVPPAVNVLVLLIPGLEPGARVDGLGANLYAQIEVDRGRWEAANPRVPDKPRKILERRDLPTLFRANQSWAGRGAWGVSWLPGFTGVSSPIRELLLASTRNLDLHVSDPNDLDSVGNPLTTAGLPELDVTDWLLGGVGPEGAPEYWGILMLWNDKPGPAKLNYRGRPMESQSGVSFYRVRVPIAYVSGGSSRAPTGAGSGP
jgi:hypothetical protein